MLPTLALFGAVVYVVALALTLFEKHLPDVQARRMSRFEGERCPNGPLYTVTPEAPGTVHPDRRHDLRPIFFECHARAYRARCAKCGKQKLFVLSIFPWPTR